MAPKVQKGSGSSIKMMSCGGAPDNLLPFKRDVTPWGQGKSFFGIMPDNDPQRGRRLLEDVGLEAFSALNGTLLEGEEGEELYEPTDPWGELLGAAGNGTADGCGGGQPSAPGRRLASSIPRRRHMGLRSSGSEMRRTGCTKTLRRVPLENNGFGPRARPLSRSGDSHIRSCLQSPSKCTPSSFSYAKSLPGIRQLSQIPKASLGKKRFRSCALVGNAGHMVKKKYGPYIDRHEVVVRFNVLGTKKFSSYVGEKTTFRVLNNARSADACCSGKLPESKGNPIGLILWYPAGRSEMKQRCSAKLPRHKLYQLSPRFINKEVAAFNALRMELQRLGMGSRLGEWKQLTSGGHAVFLFSKVCDSLSLYGFTTWSSSGPDQYSGRRRKTSSGQRWHDWGGESLAWRLLFTSGQVQICSV